MAVRIRMKKLGRRHRPFYRICAMDSRSPRDGTTIEELGTYDPMVKDVDARAVLDGERIDYWLGMGAQPTEKVKVLIKKYGTNGTHLARQKAALEKLKAGKPTPMAAPSPKKEPAAQEARQDSGSGEESAAAETSENVAEVGGEKQGE
ncbi:MAG: 30S ribosomal protein S16 [Pirellulaceae bacterium]